MSDGNGALKRTEITAAVRGILAGVERLQKLYPQRTLELDGHLARPIGQIIAAAHYDIILDDICEPAHHATASDGRRVQISATLGNELSLHETPEIYLGIKIYPTGAFEEIFNGPGHLIAEAYAHRGGIGQTAMTLPCSHLRLLSSEHIASERIPRHARTH